MFERIDKASKSFVLYTENVHKFIKFQLKIKGTSMSIANIKPAYKIQQYLNYDFWFFLFVVNKWKFINIIL